MLKADTDRPEFWDIALVARRELERQTREGIGTQAERITDAVYGKIASAVLAELVDRIGTFYLFIHEVDSDNLPDEITEVFSMIEQLENEVK